MKISRLISSIGACMIVIVVESFAQEVLPAIEIVAVNYKYLNAVDNKEVAQPVAMLEREAAIYDVKTADFYEDQYDNYFVSFFIPNGQILAAYDKEGNLLRTAEKFNNVALPVNVREAIATKFPKWTIAKEVYLVTYHEQHGATKRYKLTLENGNKRKRVRVDENGQFL